MSKKSVAVIIIVMVAAVVALGIMWRRSRIPPSPPPPPPGLVFMDTYEDNPTFRETNTDLWIKLNKDAKNGDYWADLTHWLEVGLVREDGRYTTGPDFAEAKVVDSYAHNGEKSAEATIYETPEGYISHLAGIARYIRNSSLVGEGVYEVGAWFYVPQGHNPFYVHVAMENHLNWMTGYLIHAGVNPEDSTFVVVVRGEDDPFELEVIATIDFQYNTWFKLWIIYDTKDLTEYRCGYISSTEEKTFVLDKAMISGWEPVYDGAPGFNFYATGHNLPDKPQQKLYVDDFYARVLED